MTTPGKVNQGRAHRPRRAVRRRAGFAAAGAAALLLALPGVAGAIPPDAPSAGAYVTNGPVQAIAHAGGRTYVGGDFTRVGQRSGSGAVLSAAGVPQSFPEVAGGEVRMAISDGAGGWYVGGSFTAVGGHVRNGLARVLADGTVDQSFNPVVTDLQGVPGEVNALALSPPAAATGVRTLYVGGLFSRIGIGDGQIHFNLAAINASTGAASSSLLTATSCAPIEQPACVPAVRSLTLVEVQVDPTAQAPAVDQPVLFVGGDFTRIGPADDQKPVDGIAAVWGVGATDTSGVSRAGGLVAATDNRLWTPDLGQSAKVLAIQRSSPVPNAAQTHVSLPVYLAGSNVPTPGSPVKPMLRAYQFKVNKSTRAVEMGFSGTGVEYSAWAPVPAGCDDCAVRALTLAGSSLYFGGDFTKVGTPERAVGRLGRINAILNPDPPAGVETVVGNGTPLGSPPVDGAGVGSGRVWSLAMPAGSTTTLLVGGDFDERALAFDVGSATPFPSWRPSPDAVVRTLAADASTSSVYAGGGFRSLGAAVRHGLAAFDASGALMDWAPALPNRADGPPRVHALAASDSTVYAGGQFGTAPGLVNLAAVDLGGNLLPFRPDPSSSDGPADVLALALQGSTLYVGGAFDKVAGQPRDNLAAVDAGSGALAGWAPNADAAGVPAVRAILPACGAVYVGGWFDHVGGQDRDNIAALDPASGSATPWNPDSDGAVLALGRYGPTIYAGGTFTRIGERARQKVAGLNVADGLATDFDMGIDAQTVGAFVRAVAATDSALYVGGRFVNARDAARSNVAAVDPASGVPAAWDPQADQRVDALAIGDDGVYVGGKFESMGTTGQRGFAPFESGAGSPFEGAPCISTTQSESDPGTQSDAPAPPPATSPPPPAALPRNAEPPATSPIERLAVSPATLRPRGRALMVRFRLDRGARVRFRFERRVGRRYVRFAVVTRRGKPGLNRVAFRRNRVGRRKIVPGRYRIKVAPVGAGRSASPRVAHFRMLRG